MSHLFPASLKHAGLGTVLLAHLSPITAHYFKGRQVSPCTFIRELSLNHICGFKRSYPIKFVAFLKKKKQKNFKRHKRPRPRTERMIILWSI